MHARFIRLTWENPAQTIATVTLQPDRPYFFTAGQYADITIPYDQPDGRGVTRTMTFSSSPNQKSLSFTTRLDSTSTSTYKKSLQQLRPGDRISLTDSMGDMVLPLDSAVPLVFVAGGIGIASYASMVRWLREQSDIRQATLLYNVSNTSDIIFQELFDEYGNLATVHKALYTTDSKASDSGWTGDIRSVRLTAGDVAAALLPDAQIYISGSESMVGEIRGDLENKYSIPQYRIASDYFDGYTARDL